MRKRILITGASSGLGEEMARQFAAMGRDLALCARRYDRLEQLRKEIIDAHPAARVAIRALDVDNHDDVFSGFGELTAELGGLDRVIVNAGIGKGAPLGTGRFHANKQTATTNFVSALAQCEAALEHFRAANAGHLVVISSLAGLRGMPRNLTTYSATKAGLATLAAGIRTELHNSPIAVTTIFPGYIRSEMNDQAVQRKVMMSETAAGVRSLVRAVEKERAEAIVPTWPWQPMGYVFRYAPDAVLRKFV